MTLQKVRQDFFDGRLHGHGESFVIPKAVAPKGQPITVNLADVIAGASRKELQSVSTPSPRAAPLVASSGCRPQPSSALTRPVPSPRMKRWRMSGGSRTV
jgi:hypothetical protein